MRRFLPLILALFVSPVVDARPKPIPVKVVVIAMFEVGADTGSLAESLRAEVKRRVQAKLDEGPGEDEGEG